MSPRAKGSRNYVQARLERDLYQRATIELILSNESWQDLLTRLVHSWTLKRRAIRRRKLGAV